MISTEAATELQPQASSVSAESSTVPADGDGDTSGDGSKRSTTTAPPPMAKGYQFWTIILALCVTALLAALENTVVTTSLPTIVEQLNMGRDYIWVTNIFFLTSAAVQPLFGQLANIFGRRWLTLFIVAIYIAGSAICGAANAASVLIFGRAIQGIGSGGVNLIIEVIVSDLVPLRQRGNYMAVIMTVYSVGTSVGPFVGGVIAEKTSWRWVFWINLPVGGVSLVMLFLFLRVASKKEDMTLRDKLKRIDYLGNAILMASSVAILYALTYGGSLYAWSDARVVAPLVLGLVGLVLFFLYEGSGWVREPVTPLRLFAHRTGAVVAVNTFLNSALVYWAMFFLSVYFQAVLLSGPARSGVQMLPLVLVSVLGAIVTIIALTKFGKYKLLHITGFAIMTVALGLFGTLDRGSHDYEWVIFQLIAGLGSAMVLNTLLPAFQAGSPESDQAAATATFAFIRSLGAIWGVAVPAAIFNNNFDSIMAERISDPGVRKRLSGGAAYEHASRAFIMTLDEPARSEAIGVYTDALRIVWFASVAFCGLGSVLALFEKDIPLRKELDTDYGLEKNSAEKSQEDGGVTLA